MRKLIILLFTLLIGASLSGCEKQQNMLSISSGGTGGVYYPLAGGMADIISKKMDGFQGTAEVTGGSIDNLLLVGNGKSEIGISTLDSAWDAFIGREKFDQNKQPIKILAILYPNRVHLVSVASRKINTIMDLRDRRVSVGSPGSGTEVFALRMLDNHKIMNSVKKARLSFSESVSAIKDGKIDAFFLLGGLPTAAVTDLAATPGVELQLIDVAAATDSLNNQFGPLYKKGIISKNIYPGLTKDCNTINIWNVLFVHQDMEEQTAYDIVKTIMENKKSLVMVHREAESISIETQSTNISPIPYHPGAIRYFREKNVNFK